MTNANRVAITGLGCICALGGDAKACKEALFQKRREPGPPTLFQNTLQIAYPVFEVSATLPEVSPVAPLGLGRTNALALAATEEALQEAGLLLPPVDPLRIGVCIGTTVGCSFNDLEFYAKFLRRQKPDMAPVFRYLASNTAAFLARHYGFLGPCQTVTNACSSSTDAIGIGAEWIRAGICDLVIAGGSDELSQVTYYGFGSLMVTSTEPCRPFDKNRKGLNLGEGAAIFILESENRLKARQGRVQTYVIGYGASCDAYHLTAPSPEGAGLRSAIQKALAASGRKPEEVAFVNTHGTGTQDNDKVESKVLHDLLPGIPFLSTKGFTGHTLGAAGAVEAALTILSLKEGKIPASPGFAEADPDLPSAPVSQPMAITGRVGMSESLAFGGHNSVIMLETADD
jgi:3-oxoacyl-[acyl-carrier-protein] synthase II